MFFTPIDRDSRALFEQEAAKTLGKSGLSFEEVTARHLVNILTTDINGNANTPTEIKVLEFAADDQRNAAGSGGPATSSIIRRIKQPIIDGSNKIPGAMAIGIFGVAVRTRIAANPLVAGAAAAATHAIDVQKALDDSVLVLTQGGSRIYEAAGDEIMNYGSGARADNVNTTATNVLLSSTPDSLLVAKKLVPCVLGAEQELTLSHFYDRQTAWTSAFQILYLHQMLIARKR